MSLATSKPQIRIQPKIPADTFTRLLDVLAAADTFYPLAFAGVDIDTGYAKKFDGSDSTVWFDGVWDIDNPYKFDAAAAGVLSLRITRPEYIQVAIPGGVVVTDIFKPVYAVSGCDYQGQLTAPTSGFTESIGSIEEIINATTVLMRPRYKRQPGFGSGALSVVTFPVELASVAAGNVVNGFTPGFAGKIRSAQFVVNKPATTASKAATITPKVNSTSTTGGAVALTSANCTPQGNVVAGTAITAANQFGASDTISLVASSVTAFVEGNGSLMLVLEAAANN